MSLTDHEDTAKGEGTSKIKTTAASDEQSLPTSSSRPLVGEATRTLQREAPRHTYTASSSASSRRDHLSIQSPTPTHISVDSPLPSPLAAPINGGETSRRGHKDKVAKRNIDFVIHGNFEIKTWYRSPYVLEDDDAAPSSMSNGASPSVHRSDSSSRGRRGGRGGRKSALDRVAHGILPSSSSTSPWSSTTTVVSGIGGALSNSAVDAPALRASVDGASMATSSMPASPTTSISSSDAPQVPPTATISTSTAPAVPVMSSTPLVSSNHLSGDGSHQLLQPPSQTEEPPVKNLWICEGCFKYMRTYAGYAVHKKDCGYTHPPGRKAYQRGALIIWEVDGEKEKLYCQNLSLFGKLFIDHKTIYFDVEPFVFYVLTEATSQFDHVLGYFSKEKISYDDYNLACIITFPPFQKRNYGTLMIEFSYYLSSLTDVAGTPERPLSDLGFKGYVSFWSAVVLRTLALAFNDMEPDISPLLLPSSYNAATSRQGGRMLSQNASNLQAAAVDRQRRACIRIRSTLLGLATTNDEGPFANKRLFPSGEEGEDEAQRAKRARRISKGWAGEMPRLPSLSKKAASPSTPLPKEEERRSTPDRAVVKGESPMDTSPASVTSTTRKSNGEVEQQSSTVQDQQDLRLNPDVDWTGAECTQERLAMATSMRTEDVAFALAELGLLRWQRQSQDETIKQEATKSGVESYPGVAAAGTPGPTIVISREAVRAAIRAKKLKVPILDETYILIDYRAEWTRQKQE